MTDDAHRPDPLTVAHLSDPHFGRHDPTVLDGLVEDVTAAAPDLVVVTGDLTMRARDAEFAQVRTFLERLPGPRLVVIGNHDVPLFEPGRLVGPYDRCRAWLPDGLEPRVELPGIRALGLQSMPRWRWKGGRVSRRQSAMVETFLGAAPAGAVRLLALHHPPSARGPARIVGRAALLRAATVAGVDLVLAGHTHVPAVTRLHPRAADHPVDPSAARRRTTRTPLEIVAGTATSTRVRGVPRSYTVIEVSASHIRVEQRVEHRGTWNPGPEAIRAR